VTSQSTPIGRQNEDLLLAAMADVKDLVDELKRSLSGVNDEMLRTQSVALVVAAEAVVRNHIPEPSSAIADDLNNLMTGLLAFRIPIQDRDLGKTPTLDLLRRIKGLMLASVNDAVEAAARMGLHARQSPLRKQIPSDVPRSQIEGLLASVISRLSNVERTLDSLESSGNVQTQFRQQNGLLNFYVGSMRVEINLTKLHLNVSPVTIDLEGITRAIEVMAELTRDFVETVRSWSDLLTIAVVAGAERVAKQVRRLSRGVRATGQWLIRASVTRSIDTEETKGEHQFESKFEPESKEKGADETGKAESVMDSSESTESLPPEAGDRFLSLRRYARAVTGSQNIADDLIESMLHRIIRARSNIGASRVALFREFSNELATIYGTNGDMGGDRDFIFSKLKQLPLLHRQVFLLLSLEGFYEEETAFILSEAVEGIRRLADDVGSLLAAIIRTKVLIIEDETFIAMDLTRLLTVLGLEVVGVAKTAAEAVQMAHQHKPGMLLADIQLSDGSSGMDAVNDIIKIVDAPAVFVTAYPERFLTGERPEPAFLISKPFQPALLAAVVAQSLFFGRYARPKRKRKSV
jgi:CheY-like chemotaxis protein